MMAGGGEDRKVSAMSPSGQPELGSPAWLHSYHSLYRRTLLDDVVPFWERHGRDDDRGGIANQIDDAGKTVGTDKFLWSQGRGLWTFAALYNRIERNPRWKHFADHIFEYIRAHGRNERGYWLYRLDATGAVLDADISIYVDGFILAGLSEYCRMAEHREARDLALATYELTLDRLNRPGSYRSAPYDIPAGLKAHGISMLFSWVFFALGQALQRDDIAAEGVRRSREVLNHFYVTEKDAILEFVSLDGGYVDSPAGRACVPGHALESLWFAIMIMEYLHERPAIDTCCRLIHRHLELGWDEDCGGLRLALDIDGKTPAFWQHPDYKPWWVHVEGMVATAYAYKHTRDTTFLQWHRRIQEYAYAHYPVRTGEWTQWLDREGRKVPSAALPVKDPFHLPRALIVLTELFAPDNETGR